MGRIESWADVQRIRERRILPTIPDALHLMRGSREQVSDTVHDKVCDALVHDFPSPYTSGLNRFQGNMVRFCHFQCSHSDSSSACPSCTTPAVRPYPMSHPGLSPERNQGMALCPDHVLGSVACLVSEEL